MKFVDYHVHSSFSCDGESTIFEMCEKAVEVGLVEIGFSDHMDFDPKDWGYKFFDYNSYSSEIARAQAFFNKKLIIRKGVEVDYQRCFEDEIKEWLKNKDFDYKVGSVHYIDHHHLSHKLVESNDLRKVYDVYFKEVVSSIESELFDILGHFDYVSSFLDNGKSEPKRVYHWNDVTKIFEKIVKSKMYLEVNSKGLRKSNKNTIPSKNIVEAFSEYGGNSFSIGSDAHSTLEMGSGIKEILDILKNCNGNKVKLLFE
jgi:histidinol-phosphatase (PHP family)